MINFNNNKLNNFKYFKFLKLKFNIDITKFIINLKDKQILLKFHQIFVNLNKNRKIKKMCLVHYFFKSPYKNTLLYFLFFIKINLFKFFKILIIQDKIEN